MSFDVFSAVGIMGCTIEIDFMSELLMTCIAPVAVAVLVLLYACVSSSRQQRDHHADASSESSSFATVLWHGTFLRIYLVVLFTLYPTGQCDCNQSCCMCVLCLLWPPHPQRRPFCGKSAEQHALLHL